MKKKRNEALNVLEGVACICVVMLHCSFPGDVGRILYGVSRFAVPLFFAVSGYFVYSEEWAKVRRTLPDKGKHIAVLFLGTEILYFIWHILRPFLIHGNFMGAAEWLAAEFTTKNILDFIIFQKTLIGDVSWFLVALLMCYLVTFPIAKYNIWNTCTLLIIHLLCINILLGEFGTFAGIKIQWYWSSTFWLLGFPCYALGFWMRIREEKIRKLLTPGRTLAIILATGALSVIERAVTGENQLYFSNIPFMTAGFIFCLNYPELPAKSYILRSFGRMGEKYSFGIYILHPIVRDVLKIIADKTGFSDQSVWGWCLPIMVVMFSLMLWWAWRTALTWGKLGGKRIFTGGL